ncbi:hypothetical protein [Arthrobacter sp. UYEF21]|uniref:hypothetical protein n=1 Tax=Arthrobacter sp. UYEF21 TaxID=1756364 RepID=UPI00339A1773
MPKKRAGSARKPGTSCGTDSIQSLLIGREDAQLDITANVVCPGPTDTPLLQDMLATEGSQAKS